MLMMLAGSGRKTSTADADDACLGVPGAKKQTKLMLMMLGRLSTRTCATDDVLTARHAPKTKLMLMMRRVREKQAQPRPARCQEANRADADDAWPVHEERAQLMMFSRPAVRQKTAKKQIDADDAHRQSAKNKHS